MKVVFEIMSWHTSKLFKMKIFEPTYLYFKGVI